MNIKTRRQVDEELFRALIDREHHKKQMEYYNAKIIQLKIYKRGLKR